MLADMSQVRHLVMDIDGTLFGGTHAIGYWPIQPRVDALRRLILTGLKVSFVSARRPSDLRATLLDLQKNVSGLVKPADVHLVGYRDNQQATMDKATALMSLQPKPDLYVADRQLDMDAADEAGVAFMFVRPFFGEE